LTNARAGASARCHAEEVGRMDQPTAEDALRALDVLVGEWALEARPPGGDPWPGGGQAVFEWHESGAHLIQRFWSEVPEAPNGVCIIGCDAANGAYYQLYSDDRGVCRVYEMSIEDGEWQLWRTGEPFAQRFTGAFSDDGTTIAGRWELAEDGSDFAVDFDLTYRRVRGGDDR
jgi:hypothetical protein